MSLRVQCRLLFEGSGILLQHQWGEDECRRTPQKKRSVALSEGLYSLPEERQEYALCCLFIIKFILFTIRKVITVSPEISEYFLDGFSDGGASILQSVHKQYIFYHLLNRNVNFLLTSKTHKL